MFTRGGALSSEVDAAVVDELAALLAAGTPPN
jgi:hypothetical protein